MHDIRTIQQNYPRAGRFRVRGLLAKRSAAEPPSLTTIGRAMAKNRQFHAAPGPWMSDRTNEAADGQIKRMLYQPDYRHQYWFIDIRYLVKRDGHWIYSICILEGYSRKLLAGMASEYQDLIAVLQLLAAALTEYGRPMGIVSDNGAVFTAQTYRTVLETLDIRACYIEKGKPWQNLIEAQFKIQLRLADHLFAQAPTNDAIQTEHARFIELFNTTAHGAHQDRDDNRRTPLEVLGWVRGQFIDPATLREIFRQLHVERTVNRQGYISIQRFYIYAERGLARQRVSIWLYEGQMQIEYQQTMLARYAATYDRKHTRVRTITQPQIRRTSYADAQLELWELDDTQWRKVLERPLLRRQRTSHGEQEGEQLPLPLANLVLVLICAAAVSAYSSRQVGELLA